MKITHIGLLLIIGLAITYLVSTSGNYSTYTNFPNAAKYEGKEFQVIGNLNHDKEIHYDPVKNANYCTFFIVDKDGNEQKVVYHDAPPPDFERSEDVVLNGMMQNGDFIATKILLKCPSKYEDGTFEEKVFESKQT